MKHVPFFFCAILVLSGSTAWATGIDLNWNQCLASLTVRVQDRQNLCDPADPVASNNQTFRLFASVRTGTNIPGVIAAGGELDFQTESAVLSPWWQMGAGECREGSIRVVATGFSESIPTTCNRNLMAGSPPALSVSLWESGYPDPTRARYRFGMARTTGVTAVGATQYLLAQIEIDAVHSVPDPANPQDPTCPGCKDRGCFQLAQVEVDRAATPQWDGRTLFTTAETASFVTWNGSTGLNGCPGIVGVRRATWGQVKSLYR